MDLSTQIYNVLNKDKILPRFIKDGLRLYENQGYEFLRSRVAEYHPAFMQVPSTVCPSHPVQGMYESFDDYAGNFLYYQQQEAFVKNVEVKIQDKLVQDIFILQMKESAIPKLQEIIKKERDCTFSTKKARYQGHNFLATVRQLVIENKLDVNSRSKAINYKTSRSSATNSIMTFNDDEKNFTEDGLFAITFDGMKHDDLKLKENVMLENALGEISEQLRSRKPFDTTKPCAICGKIGHTFQNCEMIQSNEGQRRLIKLYFAAKRFSNIQRSIFESDPDAPSLNAMQSFPLSQLIEMEPDLSQPSILPVHSLQPTVPVQTPSPVPKPSKSLKTTMSVVAQHGTQLWDLERRLKSQNELIHQLLGSHHPDNDTSSETSLNSVASDSTTALNNFLGAGS